VSEGDRNRPGYKEGTYRIRPLTDRQLTLLRDIVGYQSYFGYSPSYREMAASLGVSSTNGVSDHLDALERKGCIVRPDGVKTRVIRVTDAGRMAAAGGDVCEPWEMRRGDFVQMWREYHREDLYSEKPLLFDRPTIERVGRDALWGAHEDRLTRTLAAEHEGAVIDAVLAGRTVCDEVLCDYPNLDELLREVGGQAA